MEQVTDQDVIRLRSQIDAGLLSVDQASRLFMRLHRAAMLVPSDALTEAYARRFPVRYLVDLMMIELKIPELAEWLSKALKRLERWVKSKIGH